MIFFTEILFFPSLSGYLDFKANLQKNNEHISSVSILYGGCVSQVSVALMLYNKESSGSQFLTTVNIYLQAHVFAVQL